MQELRKNQGYLIGEDGMNNHLGSDSEKHRCLLEKKIQLPHSTSLRHRENTSPAPLVTPASSQHQRCIIARGYVTYVVTQVSFTTTVGVGTGQQAAGQDSVVMISRIQSASMHFDGGGGQFRSLVEVTVGQNGCAEVVMVVSTALTVVKVL